MRDSLMKGFVLTAVLTVPNVRSGAAAHEDSAKQYGPAPAGAASLILPDDCLILQTARASVGGTGRARVS
jgi:hypothetical protein